ncbi:Flagellar hook-length control protein FliK [Thauera aromatica K172]|uniref:Flagellar hook-length control protein FliK n=1 Tax=Thauera aromatica K172 TaxID=44139 RepID=A0A2R4BJ03_THAAR|nr:Flagellar hook-length control protein FliK [Thauera aromatica K172]
MAGAAPAGPSAAPASATLHHLPGSAQWPVELGQQLLVHGRDGARQIELRLSPPELGPLSVTLSMTERSAQLQFVAHHVQVRDALEQALPQLREALASQGITLGEAGVSDRRGDSQGSAGFTAGGRSGGEAAPDDGGEAGIAVQAAAAALLAAGRVDIHV